MNTSSIVQKLWNYCNVLRDDSMSYGDYPSISLGTVSEQLTPSPQPSPACGRGGWVCDEDALFDHYRCLQ